MVQLVLRVLFAVLLIFVLGEAAYRETPCQRELRINTENTKKGVMGARIPVCDKKGNYAPKQCSGSQCYCVTRVLGTTIPGYSVNVWEADDQNCLCARDEVEMGKNLNCDSKGNYRTPCFKKRC